MQLPIEKLADVFGITISQFFEMANMDEGEIVISNIDKTSVATISNNNDGSQNSAKGNAFVQNLKKYKEWYLMIGLAIVILALALVAFALHTLWRCWWCGWRSIRIYKCYGHKKY